MPIYEAFLIDSEFQILGMKHYQDNTKRIIFA